MAVMKRKRENASVVVMRTIGPFWVQPLSLAAAVWTEDADFFGTGVAVWTTNRIEIFLRSQNTSEEG